MFNSQCLLSRNGPLGAIWVAAYFFKKLKKAQVTETDISSSIDKILENELDVITYRVLAYLLLGVVRIYSKKVEYLIDDCHEVLIKINEFVVSEKNETQTETLRAPYYAITLPDRFELDAFDLEILDDVSCGNVAPKEEITLKDGAWKTEGIGQYSLDKYTCEEFATSHDTCSTDYIPIEDCVVSSYMRDIEKEVNASHELNYFEASLEKFQSNMFPQEKCVNLATYCGVEEEPPEPVKSFGEDQQTVGEHIQISETTQRDNEMCGEASVENLRDDRFSQEKCVNLEMFCEAEEEPRDLTKPFGQDHQTGEKIKVPDMTISANEMRQFMKEGHNSSNLQESIEKLQYYRFSQEEYMAPEVFCGAEEEPPKLVRPFGEEHHSNAEQVKIPEMTLLENGKCQVLTEGNPVSVTLDATPQSRFPNASGATTPGFVVIPTPDPKESAQNLRKRKCFFDDVVVLPNSLIKKCIEDSSNLVSKRRKAPRTALAFWKACLIPNLSQCFLEPSIPCVSSELRSLFCKKRFKISESVATLEPLEKLDVADTVDPPEKLDMPKTVEPPEKLDVPEFPIVGRLLEPIMAPETPVRDSASMRAFESPRSPKNYNSEEERPENSFESVGKESPASKDQELDLNLENEETNSLEGENQELYGWSGRSRRVAGYLDNCFLNQMKRREEETVNLLQLAEGRTKKESARLFYEILVLKTGGHVDVKQENAYGDILIHKTPSSDSLPPGGSLDLVAQK